MVTERYMMGALPDYFVLTPKSETDAIECLNLFYQVGGVLYDGTVDFSITDYPYFIVQMRGTYIDRPTLTPASDFPMGENKIDTDIFINIDPTAIIEYELSIKGGSSAVMESYLEEDDEDLEEWLEVAEEILT